MDYSKVTKGRTVHAKWTAFIFVQSSTYEFKYLDMFEVITYFLLFIDMGGKRNSIHSQAYTSVYMSKQVMYNHWITATPV